MLTGNVILCKTW